MAIRSIEINFPTPVELPEGFERVLDALINVVCLQYQREHPDQVMWPAGHGAKMLCNPMALSDDEPIPFDHSVYCIDVACREDLHGDNPHNPEGAKLRAAVPEFHSSRSENAQRYEFMRRMMIEDRDPPQDIELPLDGDAPTEQQFDEMVDAWRKACTL